MGTLEAGQGGSIGQWKTLQPGIPQAITDIAATINSFAQALITLLNIALAILGIIKAFLIGFTDPLIAIIEAIVNEVEAFLRDLRQIGLYITGDLNPQPPFDTLTGGFAAYERRMIGRLVDRTDPTRPSFSSNTAGIGIFLYAGGDVSQIDLLLNTIFQIQAFFGQLGDFKPYTVPVDLQVTYGVDGAALSAFRPNMSQVLDAGETPNAANLKWKMAPPPNASPTLWPLPAPKGFLVEVSTVPNGLGIMASTTVRNHERTVEGGLTRRNALVAGPDGLPFRLYGGGTQLDFSQLSEFNDAMQSITSNDSGATAFYGFRDATDTTPIPLDMLRGNWSGGSWTPSDTGNTFLLQRTFYIRGGSRAVLSGPGQGFTATLAYEDMPHEAEFVDDNGQVVVASVSDAPATSVFIRIAAVTGNVTAANARVPGEGSDFKWGITVGAAKASSESGKLIQLSVTTEGLGVTDRAEVSSPLAVTFPGTETQQYLEVVAAALAVMVLSRSDLPVLSNPTDPVENRRTDVAALATGLEGLAKYLVPQMLGVSPARYFKKEGVDPTKFRRRILRASRALANDLYYRTGALGDSIEGLAVDIGQPLLDFKWSAAGYRQTDLTIMESLADKSLDTGLGLNPTSISKLAPFPAFEAMKHQSGIVRAPSFIGKSTPRPGQGSADYSPVIYSRSGGRVSADFCRNVILGHNDGELYTAAVGVLNIASGPMTLPKPRGNWIALRLLPQGLPPVDQAMEEILNWVKSILSGVSGIVDLIRAYIEFIETRILELQSIIERINNLLQSLLAFQMPQMSGLIVSGAGVDGILQALIQAQDKPQDAGTESTYGAGTVLVAGGLPPVIVEILKLFFPEV